MSVRNDSLTIEIPSPSSAMIERPENLPDYTDYPLNEVVLGIQFSPAKGYQQILALDVWKLYRENFSRCETHQSLAPVFETFGPPKPSHHSINLRTGPTHDRFWFVNESGDQLIQFQEDRLIHNWRKISDTTSEYPRFEAMYGAFTCEIQTLERYFNTLSPQDLSVSQCEVTYTNFIVDPANPLKFPTPSDWLKYAALSEIDVENIQMKFSRQVTRGEKPIARLHYETAFAINPILNHHAISLQLTVRGAPFDNRLEGAFDFLSFAREMIVNEFTRITTPHAHKVWGRIK